ncbi:DUF1127 domain-containing protein [Variovorax sp. DT-64]|uniref:DUF1127 domain-containing protein n=1 Tax=Variovorax sp. DT-64 TaxID=3396160 RepID=UPI003F1BF03F
MLIGGFRNLNFHNSTPRRTICRMTNARTMELEMQMPLTQLLRQLLARLLVRWAARRRAHRQALQLAAMSEHELLDLGIGRSEVPALLRGTQPHAGCCPRR